MIYWALLWAWLIGGGLIVVYGGLQIAEYATVRTASAAKVDSACIRLKSPEPQGEPCSHITDMKVGQEGVINVVYVNVGADRRAYIDNFACLSQPNAQTIAIVRKETGYYLRCNGAHLTITEKVATFNGGTALPVQGFE